ncbi:hypothetical protein [Chitinophaga sp. GbtcB8]|uniref:hypothetical protein n=1 Tax=Chitinophaga sp. GbtcB8 TaxID=2824753 RepID=UPI001C2F87C6|nr:hypothetical protein [Chitinophaga sp. GbtcB8]
MKTVLRLALLALMAYAVGACSKLDDVLPPPPVNTDTTKGDTTHIDTVKLHLLTSQVWRYYEYFDDYSEAGAQLVWKVGKTNSSWNLSKNQVKFNSDGSYWEIDESGTRYDGTWSFQNDSTQVKVVNSVGTFLSEIKVLSADKYEWLGLGGETGHYGILMHEFPVIDPVLDSATFKHYLTAHTWMYEEYFLKYNTAATNLVWKIGKPNNTMPLIKTAATFNADGTTRETDERGTVIYGTWRMQNNNTELRVSNSVGTFISKVKVLTANRFEWNRLDDSYYYFGSMIPQQ